MAEEMRTEEPEALKKKLLGRIGIAAVLIGVLLGGLALFDRMSAPEPVKVTKAPVLPEAVLPTEEVKVDVVKPELPNLENKPEDKLEAKKEEIKAEPEKTEAPVVPHPLPVAAQAVAPTKPVSPVQKIPKPETKPEPKATHAPVSVPKLVPVPAPASLPAAPQPSKKADTQAVEQKPVGVQPTSPTPINTTTKPEPKSPPLEVKPAPIEAKPGPVESAVNAARGYLLQLGVFNNTYNAEDLRSKLEKNGIPSTVESRVQIGPFKTREEAEVVQAKLKSLGMDAGVLMPPKK